MITLLFLFAALLATGLFFILADIVKLPTIAATKALISSGKQDKKLAKTVEAWLVSWAVKASRFVRMDEYRRSRMKNILKASGIIMTPEVYMAYAYVKAGAVLLGVIPCLFVFPLLSPVADIAVYAPQFKDWNEDVKARNGVTPIPAQEHPKIMACLELLDELDDMCGEKNAKATTWDTILTDCSKIAALTQMGRRLTPDQAAAVSERLQSMAATALLRVMADCRQMERPVTVEQLMSRLRREYAPHKDRDKFRAKIESIHQTVNGLGGQLHASGIRTLDDRKKIISDTMSLAMQCVKAQIFIQTEYQNQLQAHREAPYQEEQRSAMTMA